MPCIYLGVTEWGQILAIISNINP